MCARRCHRCRRGSCCSMTRSCCHRCRSRRCFRNCGCCSFTVGSRTCNSSSSSCCCCCRCGCSRSCRRCSSGGRRCISSCRCRSCLNDYRAGNLRVILIGRREFPAKDVLSGFQTLFMLYIQPLDRAFCIVIA